MTEEFPYMVSDGHVVLMYDDPNYVEKNGIKEPFKKIKIRKALVVSIGLDVAKIAGNKLVPGRYVLMPSVNKQQFVIGGKTYYVCHYLDIKVIDPLSDDDLMLELFENHYASLPKRVSQKFAKKIAGL